jgi:hypothetical protein
LLSQELLYEFTGLVWAIGALMVALFVLLRFPVVFTQASSHRWFGKV